MDKTMKKLLLPALIILSGCATPMTDEKIAAMSNDQLCAAVTRQPNDVKLMAFMSGRNLYCHPYQKTCTKAGFKQGSERWLACVKSIIADEQVKQQQSAQAWASFGKSMQNYSNATRPVTTNCFGGPYGATCQTY